MSGEQGAIARLRSTLTAVGCEPLPGPWVRRLALEKQPDEELLWVARPTDAYGRIAQASWLVIVGLFVLFTVRSSDLIGEFVPEAWAVWIIPAVSLFVLVGLAGVFWFGPRWDASRTLYVLTNRRALLMRFGTFFRIRAFDLMDVQRLTRFELENGNGDLVFERFSLKDEEGNVTAGENGFYGIADVRQVEKLLQAIIDQKESRS